MMNAEAEKFCANCLMHHWKQPEDKSSLKDCRGCGMIQYCSRPCRKEHWEKVHKDHCQFLADPAKCPQSQHDARTCDFCHPPSGAGKDKRKMTAGKDKKRNQVSSSYECFIKDIDFLPGLGSPHPFPVAGVENDLLEKDIIIMQKLVHKLQQNPRVAKVCSAELSEMELLLWNKRRDVWFYRKVLSHRQMEYKIFGFHEIKDLLQNVLAKVSQGKTGKDASELSKIVYLILVINGVIASYRRLEVLKNPVDNIPEQFRDLVKRAMDNKVEFLNIAEEIIDSLSTQVIPYEDIIKKLCGDKKRQKCSFCGIKIEVTDCINIQEDDKKHCDRKCSSVLFDALSIRVFSCGSPDCQRKADSRLDDMNKFRLAVTTACMERVGVCCDFCFQLCPINKAHRCCYCLTVVYCSKDCNKANMKEHWEYCIKDERKTKEDRSMRRQTGEITPEKMAFMTAGTVIENREDILNETLEAFHFEDGKSKAEDVTVPAAEDATGTGAAPNAEHTNNRSTTGTGAGPNAGHVKVDLQG